MRQPKKINVAEDIVPIGQFKTHASEEIRRLHKTGRPIVITQNGRPTAVLILPVEFEELGYKAFRMAKIQAGLDSAKNERTYSEEEVFGELEARIAKEKQKRLKAPALLAARRKVAPKPKVRRKNTSRAA